MNFLTDFQIPHYTERLQEARQQGDVKAIAFLRRQLFNFKNLLK